MVAKLRNFRKEKQNESSSSKIIDGSKTSVLRGESASASSSSKIIDGSKTSN